MSYSAEIEVRGLVGVTLKDDLLWLLAVNVTQPQHLRLTGDVKQSIYPHSPQLFIRGSDGSEAINLPHTENTYRCILKERWKSVDLVNLDLRIGVSQNVDSSLILPSNFPSLQDIADARFVSREHTSLPRKLISSDYGDDGIEQYPLVSSRIRIWQGVVSFQENGYYAFPNTTKTFRLVESVKIILVNLIRPVEVSYRPLQVENGQGRPFSSFELRAPEGKTLWLGIDNNPRVYSEGAACPEGFDFCAHYHSTIAPDMLGVLPPYPLDEVTEQVGSPGPADNAQCSPVEYEI